MPDASVGQSEAPVYRAEIRETDNGWFWRVEVDVRNGRAWSGDVESFVEAAARASRQLLALRAVVDTPLRGQSDA